MAESEYGANAEQDMPDLPEPAAINLNPPLEEYETPAMDSAEAPAPMNIDTPILPPLGIAPTSTPDQDEDPSDDAVTTQAASSHSCKCLKTKCLKLYCDCFRHNSMCSSACSCNSCNNNMEHNGPAGSRTLAMLATLRSRPTAFDSGLPFEPGRNEESVLSAYAEIKRIEEQRSSQEEILVVPSRRTTRSATRKNKEAAEDSDYSVKEKRKGKPQSKWTLPPLDPVPVPNHSIEEVLAEYAGHLYTPPPFTLEEYPTLAIDTSKDYSSLVNKFKTPLFKDPSPPLAIAYSHQDVAASERTLLHSKKHEILARLDAIRRQFAETKAELLNLNEHLKNNTQKTGGWTHKVFELELAEPCSWNDKLKRLKEFNDRYGVVPSNTTKKFNFEELEAAKKAADAKARQKDEGSIQEKTNEGKDEMNAVVDSIDPKETELPAEGGEQKSEANDPPVEEAKPELSGNTDNVLTTDQPVEEDVKQDLDSKAHPDDAQHEEESKKQQLDQTNEQSDKENDEAPEKSLPHFTEEETKQLATFIAQEKLKLRKDKQIAKSQPHRIRALEECGVKIRERESAARFDEMFEKLLAYRKEMGMLKLPSADVCKASGDQELIALHNWVFSQIGSFRYQLKSKKVEDVKRFLDIGFSFERWYATAGHVFERDIPPFDEMARKYVESGGEVPPEYDEMLRGQGKYATRKRKSKHGPLVKRYSGPDMRFKKNRISTEKVQAEAEVETKAVAEVEAQQPLVREEEL